MQCKKSLTLTHPFSLTAKLVLNYI